MSSSTTITSLNRLTCPMANITARLPSPRRGRCIVMTACRRPMPPSVINTRRTAGIIRCSAAHKVAPIASPPSRQCSAKKPGRISLIDRLRRGGSRSGWWPRCPARNPRRSRETRTPGPPEQDRRDRVRPRARSPLRPALRDRRSGSERAAAAPRAAPPMIIVFVVAKPEINLRAEQHRRRDCRSRPRSPACGPSAFAFSARI